MMTGKRKWICLLVMAVLISAGGLLYYRMVSDLPEEHGGTLVETRQELREGLV